MLKGCEYNIKIVEGNDFVIVIPLKSRTYVSCKPIDEDIIIRDLEDIVVKINDTEYAATLEDYGVSIPVKGNLLEGNYSVNLTAIYHGISIRAAYQNAISIVSWNNYSNAQQYLQGSPVALPAAYVLGVMTDAELEALKQQLREQIAATEQAQADAEAAKEEYDRKAEMLDDVAKQGTNPNATNTAILQAALDAGAYPALVAQCYDILIAKSVNIPVQPSEMDLSHLPQTLEQINKAFVGFAYASALPLPANVVSAKKYNYSLVLFPTEVSIGGFFHNNNYAEEVEGLTFKMSSSGGNFFFDSCPSLKRVIANIDTSAIIPTSAKTYWFTRNATLQYLSIRGFTFQGGGNVLYSNPNLQWLDISNSHILPTLTGARDSFLQLPACETFVGDETIDSVIHGNICVLEGCHIKLNFTNMPLLNRQSLRAVINGLADLTGESAQTFTLGATLLAKLTTEDIAVATNKNWNLA